MTELADVFAELDDPRAVNARCHSLHEILVIALCTVVSGGQTCTGMELYGHAKRDLLQSFLKLENGIPSHDTFSRVLRTHRKAHRQRQRRHSLAARTA